jgi:quinoprotein glucose dehydrogenase
MIMRRVIESDICIIGSGITAAMVAEKIAAERSASIVVVEAGDHAVAPERRGETRGRFVAYGENPWPNDHVDGQTCDGIQSRSMMVGGMAMHWGGVTPRFSPEDFRLRSLYGVHEDWPITYDDLEPFYVEAERRMGVAGEQGPPDLDPRSSPFPQPPLPLSYNLKLLKEWAEKSDIPFWSQPSAKNSVAYGGRPVCCRNDTCSPICPIGAKYSPDATWRALVSANRVQLMTGTLVRRLVPVDGTNSIAYATASTPADPATPIEFRARTFVIACGYVWSVIGAVCGRPGQPIRSGGQVHEWSSFRAGIRACSHEAVSRHQRTPQPGHEAVHATRPARPLSASRSARVGVGSGSRTTAAR